MRYPPIPETNPKQTCRQCGKYTYHWLWRLVEPAPHSYEKLCTTCCERQDATFTAEAAIAQARGITLIYGAELNGHIVRSGGAG